MKTLIIAFASLMFACESVDHINEPEDTTPCDSMVDNPRFIDVTTRWPGSREPFVHPVPRPVVHLQGLYDVEYIVDNGGCGDYISNGLFIGPGTPPPPEPPTTRPLCRGHETGSADQLLIECFDPSSTFDAYIVVQWNVVIDADGQGFSGSAQTSTRVVGDVCSLHGPFTGKKTQ